MNEISITSLLSKTVAGSTEIRTRIVGFRVQSANHYTIEPYAHSVQGGGLKLHQQLLLPFLKCLLLHRYDRSILENFKFSLYDFYSTLSVLIFSGFRNLYFEFIFAFFFGFASTFVRNFRPASYFF